MYVTLPWAAHGLETRDALDREAAVGSRAVARHDLHRRDFRHGKRCRLGRERRRGEKWERSDEAGNGWPIMRERGTDGRSCRHRLVLVTHNVCEPSASAIACSCFRRGDPHRRGRPSRTGLRAHAALDREPPERARRALYRHGHPRFDSPRPAPREAASEAARSEAASWALFTDFNARNATTAY